ncbi:MAG: hypothetical protein NW208_15445, partial [Bryobacter sp.]|nr:hypothetical protein [Bryobacter sp.]
EQGNDANPFQLMRNAGHTRMDVSLLYTQADRQRDRTAVLRHQKRVIAASTKRVGAKPASAKPSCNNPSKLRILALPRIVVLGRKDRKAKEEEWWACADSNCRPLPCQRRGPRPKRRRPLDPLLHAILHGGEVKQAKPEIETLDKPATAESTDTKKAKRPSSKGKCPTCGRR